ncbi:alpha/beta fold hydrolase [Bacillus tianshenii]|nr:alpha/beta fold hydrolase [Bacillus tianshenii]
MIVLDKEQPAGIPLLHVVQQEKMHQKLPTVIFVHGFTSAKEHNLHVAYYLAEAGIRVLLPEALHHGDRDEGLSEEDLMFSFWKIVIHTIHELEAIKEYYTAKEFIEEDKIGLVGTSMGGIVTLGALTQYDWIQSAVSLMGNPSYESFSRWQMDGIKKSGAPVPLDETEIEKQIASLKPYDLSAQLEKACDVPLLFWHGKLDQVVPFEHANDFYYNLRSAYPDAITEFIEDEKAGHKVSREGVLATVEWFEKHLMNQKVTEKQS